MKKMYVLIGCKCHMFASKHSKFRVLWVGLVSYRRGLFKFCRFWVGCSWRFELIEKSNEDHSAKDIFAAYWIKRGLSLWLLSGHSLSLQNSSNPDKSYSSEIIKVHRVRTKSWILTEVLNFIQLFSRPGKSEENGWSLGKMKKSLEFFSKLQQVLYKWSFFFLFLLFFF